MSRSTQPWVLLVSLLAAASSVSGCGSYRPGAQPVELGSGLVEYSANGNGLGKINRFESSILMPDGRGGYLVSPGGPRQGQPAAVIEAQELRLRVRELASQLLETRSNEALAGLVALPTSFVDLNDFTDSSPLGRYMAEAMFYEFNQRGVPVREYRMDGKIRMREAQGEFALTRQLPPLNVKQKWSAVLLGTYLKEGNAYFVNVRLVRPIDGMVLRTGQIVFGNNTLLAEMTAKPVPPPPPPFSSGTMRIVSPSSSSPSARTSSARRGG